MPLRRTLLRLALLLAATCIGCHSAGPYGHSRIYAPLSEEEDATEGAVEFDPVMAKRQPEKWKGALVSLFGVVKSRKPGRGGTTEVTLSIRTLEARNLCDSADEDTCRVTVGEREHAIVHALLQLRNEDDIGKLSLSPRSLVRVVGTLADDADATDGAPVVVARYYRHWPRDYYVTTASRALLRR